MKKLILALSIAGSLASCATSPDYDDDYPAPTGVEAARDYEAYVCYEVLDSDEENPLFLFRSIEDQSVGYITNSLIFEPAIVGDFGLKTSWLWSYDEDRDIAEYEISLQANGTAHYFDFSNADKAKSSQTFKCTADDEMAEDFTAYMEQVEREVNEAEILDSLDQNGDDIDKRKYKH